MRGEREGRAFEVVTEVDGAAGDGVGELAGGGVGVVEHRGEGGAQGRDAPLHLPSHGGGGDGEEGLAGDGDGEEDLGGFPFLFETFARVARAKVLVSDGWAHLRYWPSEIWYRALGRPR